MRGQMRHAPSRFSRHRAVKIAHRLQHRLGALVRFHQQDGGPPQLGKRQRRQQRLRRIGQPGQAHFAARAPQRFERFLDHRAACHPREKLADQRKNHA